MAATKIKTPQLDETARLKTKIIQITRDLTSASGNVAYTGIGFKPSAIIAFTAAGVDSAAVGMADSAKGGLNMQMGPAFNTATAAVGGWTILYSSSGGNYQWANIASYDADGFTLSWNKVGSPTGTLYVSILCFG